MPNQRKPRNGSREEARNALKQSIATGKYPFGTRLPPVRHIALSLGISKRTASLALADLKEEGLIESRERAGSFVRVGQPPASIPDEPAVRPAISRAQQIAEELMERISLGDIKTGEALPLRKTLKHQMRTSTATLNHALKLVESQRLLHRRGQSLIAGSADIRLGSGRKVYALPAWSVPQNSEIRDRAGFSNFNLEFEKELSRNQHTYIGRFGPDVMRRLDRTIKQKENAAGYHFACSQMIVQKISAGSQQTMEQELRRIDRTYLPVVLFNCVPMQAAFPGFTFKPYKNIFPLGFDNRSAGKISGQYLAELGHRHVAFFSFSSEAWNHERFEGMMQGLKSPHWGKTRAYPFHGEFQKSNLFSLDYIHSQNLVDDVRKLTRRAFNNFEFQQKPFARRLVGNALTFVTADLHHTHLRPFFEKALTISEITAWVTADSTVGLAASAFLASKGIDVPGRMSLLAMDDNEELSDHAISGCDMQIDRLAYLAAHCIVGDIPIRRDRKGVVECPARIVDRGSVARV